MPSPAVIVRSARSLVRHGLRPLLAALLLAGTAAAADTWNWEAVGIGGGGRFLGPGVSPHNPDLLFSNSDMGGAYRSADGGAHWEMPPETMLRRLHFELRQPHHLWAFHPTDPALVFVGSPFGFFRSDDAGVSWNPLDGAWDAQDESGKRIRRGPRVVVFDRAAPDTALAVFDAASRTAGVTPWLSSDRGATWKPLAPLPADEGKIVNAIVLPSASAAGRALVVATSGGICRSDDDGRTWAPADSGLPRAGGLFVSDFDGAWKDGAGALYATATTADDKEFERVWLYVSTDGALTWAPAPRTGILANPARPATFGLLAVSAADPATVYTTIKGGDMAAPGHPGQRALYRSDDGAKTWRPVWYQDVKDARYNITNGSWLKGQWGWTYPPSGIAVSDTDPKLVFATTISSALVSHDGGETWKQVHAPEGAKDDQPAGGMMVTSAWSYAIHPSEPNRRFIALTDYSGWRSVDSGKTWSYRPDGNPWHNNTYAFAFDPGRPDLVWAACSVMHDIPTWRYQPELGKSVGGVVFSSDGGQNWIPVDKNSGLPRKPVTDLWLDPTSPARARRLWAAVPGEGFYVSEDDGRIWQARNNGISTDNLNALRIKGDGQGRLYALTTVRVRGESRTAGSVYLSTDRGRAWKKIFTEPSAPFLANLELCAAQPGVVYVAALHTVDGWETATGGGVWKSADEGRSWIRIFDKPAYAVAVDPRDPSRLYASCWLNRGDGLHTSTDGGATWTRVENYPFWRPLSVTFDPRDEHAIYVTNFGAGVFRGDHP